MNSHDIGLVLFNDLEDKLSYVLNEYYKTENGQRTLCLNLLPFFEANLDFSYFKKVRFSDEIIYIFTDEDFIPALLNSSIYDFRLFYTSSYNFLVPKDNIFCELSLENFPKLSKFFILSYHGKSSSSIIKSLVNGYIKGNEDE